MPVVSWCQRSGHRDAGHIWGSDLLLAMYKRVPQRSHRHFFYVGSPRVVEALISRLMQRVPGLVRRIFCERLPIRDPS